jgi:hypothetical protein
MRDYDVQIIECPFCSAPRPAPSEGGSDICDYCGESSSDPRKVGAFSYSIRVVVCINCAAPLPVVVGGGEVACTYCQAVSHIAGRRERRLGRDQPSDEGARLKRLRAQRANAGWVPSEVLMLMRGSEGLVEQTVGKARTMWQESRKELEGLRAQSDKEPAAKVEKRRFYLTEVLADYYNVRQRWVVSRSILESSLDDLRDPVYVQQIYCLIARNSARTGDYDSAREWLDLCDAAPEDIGMDSAHRFTLAYISLYRGDPEGIIAALGRRKGGFPLIGKFNGIATVFRAHAVEQLEGAEAAAELLESEARWQPTWSLVLDIIKANHDVALCHKSVPLVMKRQWGWGTTKAVIAVCIAVNLFLLADFALGPTLWGRQLLGGTAIGLAVVWTLVMGFIAWGKTTARLSIHRKFHEL